MELIRNWGSAIGWGLNRITKVFGNLLSLATACFTKVEKGKVMCWAYNFKQYGCNPRYLTEHILDNENQFDIYWVFRKGIDTSGVDSRIKCVRFRSLEYFRLVNSAEFLITNSRTDPYRIYWHKRPGQKYLMLWHGGVALKKIEKDVESKLGYTYVSKAKADSKVCDLMISGCRFQTELLKEKFWYSGEILEGGIPRSDIFFDKKQHKVIEDKVREYYSIPSDNKIVLYAPTFRRDHSISPYRIGWDTIIPELKKVFDNHEVTVLVRLHPNLIGKVDTTSLISYANVIDATRYHDMQELLCITDMLITDYSSSMFDMAMLGKPCLLYATDINKYDRGYYFRFDSLPFPLSRSMEELKQVISSFDYAGYHSKVKMFLHDTVGISEDGNASRRITKWMSEHQI